jgi:hypothetical protein
LCSGVRGSRLRSVLVIGQVAVSLVLIIVASTLVRNGSLVKTTDIGFDTHALVSIRPTGASAGPNLVARAYDALVSNALTAQVAVTSTNPLIGEIPLSPVRRPQGGMVVPVLMDASPGYSRLAALSPAPRLQPDEARTETKVAGVSAAAARALCQGGSARQEHRFVDAAGVKSPDVMTRDQLVATTDSAERRRRRQAIGVTYRHNDSSCRSARLVATVDPASGALIPFLGARRASGQSPRSRRTYPS